ncbi:MAG: DnaJ domain-containing protein [Halosimplex sp.]
MTETYYDRLGVSPDAAVGEIETAYREAIKRVHPDVSDDVDAAERTKRLNEAKRVLTDEDERAKYDRLGHAAYTGSGSGSNPDSRPGDGDTDSGRASTADPRGGGGSDSAERTGATGRRSTGRARDSASPDESERADGSSATGDESAWRGSQQRGRRSGRRRAAGPRDPGRRADTGNESGRAHTDGAAAAAGSGRRRRRSPDGTTRSRGDSTGPSWQSSGARTGAATAAGSPSAQRQAAAGSADGPNVDSSWNAWASTGAWAVRRGSPGRSFGLDRFVPSEQTALLVGSIFFCYPFFVGTMLYPPFPLAARAAVAVCTLLTFAYLLSIPGAAVAVFGLWSVLTPVILVAVPAASLFSLVGVAALVATWVPLGLSVLTFSLVRP